MRKQQLSAQDPGVAEILNNVGMLYWNQKRYNEAEEPLLRAQLPST